MEVVNKSKYIPTLKKPMVFSMRDNLFLQIDEVVQILPSNSKKPNPKKIQNLKFEKNPDFEFGNWDLLGNIWILSFGFTLIINVCN